LLLCNIRLIDYVKEISYALFAVVE